MAKLGTTKLDDRQIERAKRRFNSGVPASLIAQEFGCSTQIVRRVVDEEWAARERARTHAAVLRYRGVPGAPPPMRPARGLPGQMKPESETSNPEYDPARDGPRPYRDLTGLIMGDPPIGRSALDQRLLDQGLAGA